MTSLASAGLRPTVLLCNNEPVVQLLVSATLHQDSYRLVAARTGDEALARSRRERPDLILLDAAMPRRNGSDVLAELRRDPATADTPVIMLIAEAEVAEPVTGGEADHYLAKPFSPIGLASLVESLLGANDRTGVPTGGNSAILERTKSALELQSERLKAQDFAMQARQAALEQRADVNRALLDANVDAIGMVGLDGRTVHANVAMQHLTSALFGLPANPTPLETTAVADRVADPVAYLATLERIAQDPDCTTEDDFELARERRAFRRHTAPVRDAAGTVIGRLTVVRETTAEREVARLASEVSGEREAARLKAELVATISHELRTPLTGVVGFTELLIHREFDEETKERYLQTIYDEARRLTRLVDEFLDLQSIESGRFVLAVQPLELGELLERQVELSATRSPNHHLELTGAGVLLPVSGDRNRIESVIADLISNAVKYSPGGGTVAIAAAAREAFARISVTDTGLGIPAERQPEVFSRFFRVDSSDTRETGGAGLGLALCADVIAAHGGRMGFESTEGVGSTFWLELPSGTRAPARTGVRDRRLRGGTYPAEQSLGLWRSDPIAPAVA